MSADFKLAATSNKARAGLVKTKHGSFVTPTFMPVATHGVVKSLTSQQLKELHPQIILSNTYHLYLRPGIKVIQRLGGIHQFMQFAGPILTDSGGYQVFSLGHCQAKSLIKLDDRGVTFKSYRDGSSHRFTPQKIIALQKQLGVDIMMPLDDCPSAGATKEQLIVSVQHTHHWLEQSFNYWHQQPSRAALFGIIQGGTNKQLRQQSIKFVTSLPLSGYALGGLAVGESKDKLYRTVAWATSLLPVDKPRYLMGVGQPADLLWAVGCGIDMFDCVIPTRMARHGSVWYLSGNKQAISDFWQGNTQALLARRQLKLTITSYNFPKLAYQASSKFIQSESKLAPAGNLTLAYANHLVREHDSAAAQTFTQQNLKLLLLLMQHAREAIKLNQYQQLSAIFGVKI